MNVVKLPKSNDIQRLCDLKNAITDALQSHNSVTLDGEEVDYISTPLLQIMLSAHKQVHAAGGNFTIIQLSENCQTLLKDFGCFSSLQGTFA